MPIPHLINDIKASPKLLTVKSANYSTHVFSNSIPDNAVTQFNSLRPAPHGANGRQASRSTPQSRETPHYFGLSC